ncbi:MAG TPA: FeoA family protein [Longimicrobiales bacterium]|nr:FeoA family protein [Longimicrobiales bacterium]
MAATKTAAGEADLRLEDIPLGEAVEFVSFDLSEEHMEPLLERGVLPGCLLCPVRRSPFGDPIVDVEGTLLALRRETARCLCVRRPTSSA